MNSLPRPIQKIIKPEKVELDPQTKIKKQNKIKKILPAPMRKRSNSYDTSISIKEEKFNLKMDNEIVIE